MLAKAFLEFPTELFKHVTHCTQDPAFKRYFYLLENLAYVKSFNMCFDLEDCTEIFVALFTLMFKIVNDEHSGKVKNFILDVLCPLITEADYVSSELLDIILQNIVEPAKSQRKNAYNLAKDLVIKTSDTLEPYIQQFFNQVRKRDFFPLRIVQNLSERYVKNHTVTQNIYFMLWEKSDLLYPDPEPVSDSDPTWILMAINYSIPVAVSNKKNFRWRFQILCHF
jgi:hypothetical protein